MDLVDPVHQLRQLPAAGQRSASQLGQAAALPCASTAVARRRRDPGPHAPHLVYWTGQQDPKVPERVTTAFGGRGGSGQPPSIPQRHGAARSQPFATQLQGCPVAVGKHVDAEVGQARAAMAQRRMAGQLVGVHYAEVRWRRRRRRPARATYPAWGGGRQRTRQEEATSPELVGDGGRGRKGSSAGRRLRRRCSSSGRRRLRSRYRCRTRIRRVSSSLPGRSRQHFGPRCPTEGG